MDLRPYQTAAIARCREACARGARRPLLVSPTGSGKTIILATIAASAVAKGRRIVWFAHRRELVAQAAATLAALGLTVGANGLAPDAPAQVLTTQGALSREEVPGADIVFLDEAHHYVSDDWPRLLEAYPDALVIGATATPQRGDGLGLGATFDRLLVVAQIQDLVGEGHLVPCDVVRPPRALKSDELAQRPVDAYMQYATNWPRNIVFAPHVKAALEYAEQFRAKGVRAEVVHGKTPADERAAALERFAAGTVRVLVNVYVLTEGYDLPSVEIVTIARPVGSVSVLLQMIGRGMRPAPGKDRCLVLDLPGVTWRHGHPEEEREYSLDGEGISRKGMAGQPLCRVCGSLLVDGSCDECSTGAKAQDTPNALGLAMVKFARKRAELPAERLTTLTRWVREAVARGHKPGAAYHRFIAAYGEKPGPLFGEACRVVKHEREART